MCVTNYRYPLLLLDNGKREIAFKYGVRINDFDDLDRFTNINRQSSYARFGLATEGALNELFKDPSVVKVEKFVQVPCGQCHECLKENARQWALRILKEAELYEYNYFLTFTYNDEHIPGDYNLEKDFISKFNKKLKTYLKRKKINSEFRFYAVGEYGSRTARPHYHGIYFNLYIPDLKYYKTHNGNILYTSEFLNHVVGDVGYIIISGVDVGSACYVAKYCDKKKLLNNFQKEELISRGIVPEFSVMSRRPGIGSHYIGDITDKIKNDVYKIFYKNNSFSIPQYYLKKIKDDMPDLISDFRKNVVSINNAVNLYRDCTLSAIVNQDLMIFKEKQYKLLEKTKNRGIL